MKKLSVIVFNCIIDGDTVYNESDLTAVQLQHDPYEFTTHAGLTFA